MRGGFSVAGIKSAVRGGFAASLAALAGFSAFAAPPARAGTCQAKSTEQLVGCVAPANATPGANTIVLAAGTYLPESTLTFRNTSGPITLEGPTGINAAKLEAAKLEGSFVVPFPKELLVINAGVSVTMKNVFESTGGG